MIEFKQGDRVYMHTCIGEEASRPGGFSPEWWADQGYSLRPVQEHVGDHGTVLWVNESGAAAVKFDDGDERALWPDEVKVVD